MPPRASANNLWPTTSFLGAAFWSVILILLIAGPRTQQGAGGRLTELAKSFFLPAETVRVQLPAVSLRRGDPVFLQDDSGAWRQVGHAVETDAAAVAGTASGPAAEIQWYGRQSPGHYEFVYYRNRGTLAEAVEILLPPEKREAIMEEIAAAQRLHGPALTEAFRPIIENTLRQSVPVIQRGLEQAVREHQSTLNAIGRRFEAELINERVVPLVRAEVLPIVRTHGEPVATEIGQEIWNRASLFRFGWRIAYDKSPLPQRGLMQREWQRFVEQEALPVFESHLDEIVLVVKDILRDVVKNEAVREELTQLLQDIAGDAELQSVAAAIIRRAIVENQELKQVWLENWQSESAQAAMDLAGARLEPVVRRIGDEIFGTRETGISPEFARVLRNQILGKDRRWIEVSLRDSPRDRGAPIVAVPGDESKPFPMLYFAAERNKP